MRSSRLRVVLGAAASALVATSLLTVIGPADAHTVAPVNPGASTATRNVLNWLAHLPNRSSNRVASGFFGGYSNSGFSLSQTEELTRRHRPVPGHPELRLRVRLGDRQRHHLAGRLLLQRRAQVLVGQRWSGHHQRALAEPGQRQRRWAEHPDDQLRRPARSGHRSGGALAFPDGQDGRRPPGPGELQRPGAVPAVPRGQRRLVLVGQPRPRYLPAGMAADVHLFHQHQRTEQPALGLLRRLQPGNRTTYYPGSSYVDIVGMDATTTTRRPPASSPRTTS